MKKVHKISDSDSDRTIDSDEFAEFISKKAKRSPEHATDSRNRKNIAGLSPRPAAHEMSDSDDETEASTSTDKRPLCKFGSTCYRKNSGHLKQFRHDGNSKASLCDSPSEKCRGADEKQNAGCSKSTENFGSNSTGFFVTKVHGIPSKFNDNIAIDIKDILSPTVGKLLSSVQFSYMIDVPWLVEQYPKEFKSCPLLLVHGQQRDSKKALMQSAASFQNISFCQAKLPIMYGTHHTKMMFLLYESGLRIVIHTSNLIKQDWYQKTQGMWVSPVLPALRGGSSAKMGESSTCFKPDLLDYLNAYNCSELNEWCKIIELHDFSSVRVFLVGSVPGRHLGSRKTMFGHLKLRKVLTNHGPEKEKVSTASYVIGQFSSIGSLGANENQWLLEEWLSSLATVKGSNVKATPRPPLQLVFPTVENVRKSLEGYPAGANLPYSKNVAVKQTYLENYFHQWKAEITGRSEASPHIKTYLRVLNNKILWFLITSANLSKAAWGLLEKKDTQLMIRSYELGVLFLPQFLGSSDAFSITPSKESEQCLLIPYDIPLTKYSQRDEPWTWDAPHTFAPDRHGNVWQPS